MSLWNTLKSIAPIIATALGGPLAARALKFRGGKLGTEETPEAIEQAIAGMTPADMVRLKELDNQFKLEMARIGIQIDLAQIGVNLEEAKSTNWFVAGGRPAVMWICAGGLLYQAMLEPIARFTATVLFHYDGIFPTLDTALLTTILLGLLGLGAMRTVEKIRDVEGNR